MKKSRVAALVLGVLMLGMTMVSCGNDEDKVSIKSTVSVVVDGETKFGPVDVVTEGTVDAPPTVLQAAQNAFTANEVPHTVSENPLALNSVTLDGVEYAKQTTEENIYYWSYTANGVEPKSGTAGKNAVNEGDVIVFTYTAEPVAPEDLTPTQPEE